MKKIVSLITMAAMLAVSTPAYANHGQRDFRWGNDRNVHSPYRGLHNRRDRGVSTGGAIAIGLGALILGTAIADRNNRRRNNEVIVVDRQQPQWQQPQWQQPQPRQVCQDVVQHDYYGNPYVAGRNCWYER
jgi:hypothetical protein